jgi:hypothetical protein
MGYTRIFVDFKTTVQELERSLLEVSLMTIPFLKKSFVIKLSIFCPKILRNI